ncbi:hypothetical protein OX283_002805 [Flavobacterium sp. SUN052]|uniref:hypothetical protein n=1 Tax=Flavobacterium sp. SUN052 TaxID=3002441 RepID=UPI00237EC47F|nr:hypothetical protein [Flavobacterium sp. SUN052]MEC4003576.1 hypothetical protein [Flavobacterium sp. SUN052]
MKHFKILFFFTFLFFGLNTYSQTIAFKTSAVSIIEKTNQKGWGEWSDFVKAELLITIDAKKDRIVVNSPVTQVFSIKNYGDKIETETLKTVPFDCIDNNGSKCKILVITRKDEGNRMQFYINYSEVKFVYNIYQSL